MPAESQQHSNHWLLTAGDSILWLGHAGPSEQKCEDSYLLLDLPYRV